MLSVIVPVYNTEKYLRRCMDALVGQTIDHSIFEIIAVNDGSTDSSLEILNEYKEKYPDIVKVFSKENGGQATARNMGIELASGDYVGFADSDDYVDRTMFEKLYSKAVSKDADLVECHYHSMLELGEQDKDGLPKYKEIGTNGKISSHKDVRELFFNPQVSPWNKIYKRKCLIEGNVKFPEGVIYEDTSFYIKALPYIKRQEYIDEKLVYYCVRNNSTMTANNGKRVGDIFTVLKDMLDYYREKKLFSSYRKELEFFCVKIAFCSNFCRIGRINSRDVRNNLFDKTFSFVKEEFPEYKKNEFIKGKVGIYLKSVNRLNCGLYAKILSRVLVG